MAVKREGVGILVWRATTEAHSGVYGDALVRSVLSEVGLNKLVVEKNSRFGIMVEQKIVVNVIS